MAQIKQVGVGRKSSGTIDGITYYVLNGKTYARSTPNMPASVFNTTEARIRQAIFSNHPTPFLPQALAPASTGVLGNQKKIGFCCFYTFLT